MKSSDEQCAETDLGGRIARAIEDITLEDIFNDPANSDGRVSPGEAAARMQRLAAEAARAGGSAL